ncbi:MAG: L-ribulose-5-phosphate 4-epimerase AraD [Clostridiales bacterium]|nr:L-ribulose-5-phosphate 4-epimerase AraD [Clostridiales bacterium]
MEALKQEVLEANLLLPEYGLVLFTWGNASALDPESGLVVIKPSGVRYAGMTADQMVVADPESGKVVEGALRPSSDADTHFELYRRFPGVRGIVHTHSTYAVAFAQAGRGVPCYGTTHADYFYGEVPCTRALRPEEIRTDYELNTGRVIADMFSERALDPQATPGALVCGHGPFTWGASAKAAASNAAYLEEAARMALLSEQAAGGRFSPVAQELMDKHYYRKHGAGAYYGQPQS